MTMGKSAAYAAPKSLSRGATRHTGVRREAKAPRKRCGQRNKTDINKIKTKGGEGEMLEGGRQMKSRNGNRNGM